MTTDDPNESAASDRTQEPKTDEQITIEVINGFATLLGRGGRFVKSVEIKAESVAVIIRAFTALRAELEKAQQTIAALTRERDEAKENAAKFERMWENRVIEVSNLREARDAAIAERDALKVTVNQHQGAIVEWKGICDSVKKERDEARAELKRCEADFNEAIEQRDSLAAQLEQAQKRITVVEKQANDALDQLEQERARVRELEGLVDEAAGYFRARNLGDTGNQLGAKLQASL